MLQDRFSIPGLLAGAPGFLGKPWGAAGAEEGGMSAMLPCTWSWGGAHWDVGSLVPSLQFSLAVPDTGASHSHS